jgi:hypothetical protein
VGGCGTSIPRYSSELPKNLQVVAEIETGSVLKRVFPEFDVHRVDADCELQFQGRVFLDADRTEVGIPTGELLYLQFIFERDHRISKNMSVIRQGALLTPRPGYTYIAKVKHRDGLFAVELQERAKNGSVRNLERMPLSECRKRA